MVLFLPYFLHIIILFASPFLAYLLYKRKSSNHNLPPGSKGWPIIGENLEFLKACRQGNPEKFVSDRTNRYSSEVFQTSLIGENVTVFCGALANKFLFTSENKYVSTWWPRSVMKALVLPEDLSDSLKTRGILNEFLKPEALRHHLSIMDSMAKENLENYWFPCKELKARPLIKKFTFGLSLRLFLSTTDPDYVARLYRAFAHLSDGMLALTINFPGTSYYKALKGRKFILEELIAIVGQRKVELLETEDAAKQDLLARMLVAPQEEIRFLSDKEVADRILGLLIAGYDTINSVLTSVLKFLAENPEVYRKVFNGNINCTSNYTSNLVYF